MNAYEKLKHLAQDERTVQVVDGAFFSIRHHGAPQVVALCQMADRLCAMHGLSAHIENGAVVFYHLGSRAKQPACLLISMAGGSTSPSAMVVRHTPLALIQVFEGDADDTDMAEAGAYAARGIETKGRMLLH